MKQVKSKMLLLAKGGIAMPGGTGEIKLQDQGFFDTAKAVQSEIDNLVTQYVQVSNQFDALKAVWNGSGASAFDAARGYVMADFMNRIEGLKQLNSDVLKAQMEFNNLDGGLAQAYGLPLMEGK